MGYCIPEAICALLPVEKRRLAWEAMLSVKKPDRDFCLGDIVPILDPLSVRIELVTSRYMRKGGRPLHILQSTKTKTCNLLIQFQMVDLEGRRLKHCVGFDGRTIYDIPQIVQVNRFRDHFSKTSCGGVFHELFPRRDYRSWQILRVWELVY